MLVLAPWAATADPTQRRALLAHWVDAQSVAARETLCAGRSLTPPARRSHQTWPMRTPPVITGSLVGNQTPFRRTATARSTPSRVAPNRCS